MRIKLTPFESIKRLKDPDQIFDMVCAYNYFAGTFKNLIPVDDSREAFERIKMLLKEEVKP